MWDASDYVPEVREKFTIRGGQDVRLASRRRSCEARNADADDVECQSGLLS